MKHIHVLRMWIGIGCLMVSGQIGAFDLPEAWQAARQYSADYRAAQFSRDAELEREQQAKAALLPQISANASVQRQAQSLSSNRTVRGVSVQWSQIWYDKNKDAVRAQTQANSQAAQSRLVYQYDDLMLKISESYFNLLLAQDTINATTAEREAYREQLKRAQILFERGAATAVDIHEAQASYDESVAKTVQAITQKQLAENQLANYTGLNPQNISPINRANLRDKIQPIIQQHTLAEWQNLALKNNPEYQTAQWQLKAVSEAVQAARAQNLPKVSTQLSYQNQLNTVPQNANTYQGQGFSASLNVSVPIYTGGELDSKLREAIARLGEAQANLLSSERKIKLAVKQAYTENQTAAYQILAQERVLSSNQLKLKSTQTGKDFGIRSHLDLMNAQQELSESQAQLAQAQYRYLQTFLTLIKESGLDIQQQWAKLGFVASTPPKSDIRWDNLIRPQ